MATQAGLPDHVTFELVSPERLLASKPVDLVTLPGSQGTFGVLPGHMPLVSTLEPGLIEVHEGDAVTDRIFVAGGFAEVNAERCTVLAEGAMAFGDLVDQKPAIEQARADATEDVASAKDEIERKKAEAALVLAEAKLYLIDTFGGR